MYQIVKHYRNQDHLRKSFNALAQKTFDLNFEDWYQNGYWSENYDPYSVLLDGEIVANVSVNITRMRINGRERPMVQLGTVMTDVQYRNRGMIRAIMSEIEADWADKTDGIYLFANDSVLEFYPKFGFRMAKESCYFKDVTLSGACAMTQIPMQGVAQWRLLEAAMAANRFQGGCDLVDNPQLIMFYITQFMQDCVYYDPESGVYVIAEKKGRSLLIHNVFSEYPVELDDVIERFGEEVRHISLGFVPADCTGYRITEYKEADCTLFVKGPVFDHFEVKQLRIPSLAHA